MILKILINWLKVNYMKNEIINDLQNIKKDVKNKNYKKQIPNILTSIRLFSPFVLIPLFYFNKLKIAFIMILFFSLTDMFDGYLARKYQAVSTFGTYLDCLVDKIFALTILISLIIKTNINNNFYLTTIIIVLELIISIINIYAFFKDLKPKSTIVGKIKTIILFSLLTFLFLAKVISIPSLVIMIFNIITIVLQILTIISYLKNIKKRRKLISF